MTRFTEQYRQHELEGVLEDILYRGHAFIPLKKLLKLLGKGNRAAGTWIALSEAFSEVGGDARKLWIAEFPNEIIFLSNQKLDKIATWS